MVPQVQSPDQQSDNIASGHINSSRDAQLQPEPKLPNFDAINENLHTPLAQSQQQQKKLKNISFSSIPGHEHSQDYGRQSHAQATRNAHPDSYQLLERLRELHATLSYIERKLSLNLTMPEFNLVNHSFCGALDTYKSITIVIQESEHEWQEIYHTLQLCTDLISYIKETIEIYLNRNPFHGIQTDHHQLD